MAGAVQGRARSTDGQDQGVFKKHMTAGAEPEHRADFKLICLQLSGCIALSCHWDLETGSKFVFAQPVRLKHLGGHGITPPGESFPKLPPPVLGVEQTPP